MLTSFENLKDEHTKDVKNLEENLSNIDSQIKAEFNSKISDLDV